MKRTKTKATLVALLTLAVSSTAFGAGVKGREGKDSKGKDARTEISGKNETSGATTARAATVSRFSNLFRTMKVETLAELSSLNLKPADTRVMLKRASEAYDKGLFGARGDALLQAIESNPTKPEYVAIFTNNAVLAAKNMLTDANLKWTENVDGKRVEINSMDFTTGEALMIAKGSSPKFVQFMNRKTQLEKGEPGKPGLSTREAIMEALKELNISFEEFVRKCLVKA